MVPTSTYCKFIIMSIPIGIIVLKISIVQRGCKNSSVMVEPKIIIGTLNPLDLLWSELWQPEEITINEFTVPDEIFLCIFISFKAFQSTEILADQQLSFALELLSSLCCCSLR